MNCITRPRWLASLSQGVWLFLLSIFGTIAWVPAVAMLSEYAWREVDREWKRGSVPPYFLVEVAQNSFGILLLGFDVLAVTFIEGCWRLTKPEGHPPADAKDARRRWALRGMAYLPLIAAGVEYVMPSNRMPSTLLERILSWMPLVLLTFASIPLPLLLFAQLRSLARRARSAHLAEHCGIAGVGTSIALGYIGGMIVLAQFADRFGAYFLERSNIWMAIMLLGCLLSLLMILWSFYLLIRFAISFHKAAKQLKAQWRRDDRSESEAQLA